MRPLQPVFGQHAFIAAVATETISPRFVCIVLNARQVTDKAFEQIRRFHLMPARFPLEFRWNAYRDDFRFIWNEFTVGPRDKPCRREKTSRPTIATPTALQVRSMMGPLSMIERHHLVCVVRGVQFVYAAQALILVGTENRGAVFGNRRKL
ncbi:hypothetical protein CAZ04_32685 [Pseudomonas aeruginosa]|nr:hypothetical protein CAZ04_32685 [Pseudomonas aeruginosa]OTJ96369.1 hypothetical protein CAZ05_32720 [Pseudomonas aeruginosa]